MISNEVNSLIKKLSYVISTGIALIPKYYLEEKNPNLYPDRKEWCHNLNFHNILAKDGGDGMDQHYQ